MVVSENLLHNWSAAVLTGCGFFCSNVLKGLYESFCANVCSCDGVNCFNNRYKVIKLTRCTLFFLFPVIIDPDGCCCIPYNGSNNDGEDNDEDDVDGRSDGVNSEAFALCSCVSSNTDDLFLFAADAGSC